MDINKVSAVSDALKYVNGLDVKPQEINIVDQMKDSIFNPISLGFSAMQVGSTLKSGVGATKYRELPEKLKTLKDIKKGETIGGSLRSTNFKEQLNNTVDNIITKADTDAQAKAAKKAAANTGKKGFFSTIKSGFSKAGNFISSGISKIPGASQIAEGAKKLGGTKFGKFMKGTGAIGMMIFDGVFGVIYDVIPAFQQGGAKSGFKQLGKTAVTTVSAGLGWAGGTAAATALGAAIGSIFPGVGTIIGGAIGTAIGGVLGSTLAGGVAKKIMGKPETEKLQEEQFEETAAQIAQDDASMNELNAIISNQVQTEIANGTADEDTELMAEYLNNGIFSTSNYNSANSSGTNPYANTNENTMNSNTNTTTTPAASTTQGVDQSQTSFGASYWNAMAREASAGNTSIYDIPDDKLNSVFTKPATPSTAQNETNTNSVTQDTEDKVNYFAIA